MLLKQTKLFDSVIVRNNGRGFLDFKDPKAVK